MRGQPDFGMYAPKTVSASISDMGEVAARLGSIVIYDKRGDVVDFDNFEETVLRWLTVLDPATAYARLVSDNVKSGSQAVKFQTTNDDGSSALLSRQLSVLGSKRLGVEISFSKLDDNCLLRLALSYTSLTEATFAEARYNPADGKVYVRVGFDEWKEVAYVGLNLLASFTFYTMKLVADFNTGKYVRLLYAEKEFDISTISCYLTGAVTVPLLVPIVGIKNLYATSGDCWIDDFIFTQAEP